MTEDRDDISEVLAEIRDELRSIREIHAASNKMSAESLQMSRDSIKMAKERARFFGGPWVLTTYFVVVLFLYAMLANITAEWLRPHLHL